MIYELGLLWISIAIGVCGLENEDRKGMGSLKKKIDLPLKSDLKILLPVLHDILNFYLDSRNDVDLNLEYAIFLLNVLLKSLYKEKAEILPTAISYSLKHLLDKNQELMTFFKGQVNHDFKPEDKPYKNVLSLYSNESLWMSQVKRFDIKRRSETPIKKSRKQLDKFQNLDVYEELNRNSTPSPLQADFCLRRLAENPVHNTVLRKCKFPKACIDVLYKSSSVGFALTHRLLLFQFAHFGRRCYVKSLLNDSKVEEKLCKHAFSEATFLSRNEYTHSDLMFEQMTFCALIGYFEFLKHSWLDQLLEYRTIDGCFTQKRHHRERVKPRKQFESYDVWHINRDENSPLLSGLCEASITSGALTTIVLAVKYILEAYY